MAPAQPKRPTERPQAPTRAASRLITVDNILQYASDVPSMQARQPGSLRPRGFSEPRLAGRLVLPARSTKISEKLVLLPETVPEEEDDNDIEEEAGPPKDGEEEERAPSGGKSYAERLPKARRAEKLARVTAYCSAQAYKLRATAGFLREEHGAKAKLYDDCLYAVYHLPILPGNKGRRVHSSPILRSQNGLRRESREHSFQEDQVEYLVEMGSTHGEQPESTFAEMFIFSYGIAVFWNFSEHQEKDILADLTFSHVESAAPPLLIRPHQEDDLETEEFHFEYSPESERPRVFNDMITLRSGDPMIKLAMSHAIAQSTKLCFFEQRMADQMSEAQYVPRRLALTGTLGLQRSEVVKILGALFKSRVDVNLSSNVLDVPSFFWDSEPTLAPLYGAVREYLEIRPRIQVLNERCRVFLDLAEILSDSIAEGKMSRLTWIIIALIILSILVTTFEVFLRFALISRGPTVSKLHLDSHLADL